MKEIIKKYINGVLITIFLVLYALFIYAFIDSRKRVGQLEDSERDLIHKLSAVQHKHNISFKAYHNMGTIIHPPQPIIHYRKNLLFFFCSCGEYEVFGTEEHGEMYQCPSCNRTYYINIKNKDYVELHAYTMEEPVYQWSEPLEIDTSIEATITSIDTFNYDTLGFWQNVDTHKSNPLPQLEWDITSPPSIAPSNQHLLRPGPRQDSHQIESIRTWTPKKQ